MPQFEDSSLRIVYVDADEHAVLVARRIWSKNKIRNPLVVFREFDECQNYMAGRGKYADRAAYPVPSILLLDCSFGSDAIASLVGNMRQSEEGVEVHIAVLVSSLEEQEDISARGVDLDAFIKKPLSFEKLGDAVKSVNLFWELVDK